MPDKFLSGICGYEFFIRYMRPKIFFKQMIIIATFFWSIIFVSLLLCLIPKNSIKDSSTLFIENVGAFSNQEQTNIGLPMRLKIPIISVDSKVISAGLTSDGAMDAPEDPAEVVWFNLRARPGENGTAVIAGHHGWKNNMLAVFDNLHQLNIGDKIFVEDDKGVNIAFVVRKIEIYDKDEAVPSVFGAYDGKAHLNLVTCTGDWNKTEKVLSERLVVFTDKE